MSAANLDPKTSSCCDRPEPGGSPSERATSAPILPLRSPKNASNASAAELTVNDFLVRRAEMLGALPGNPYGVEMKKIGDVEGVLTAGAPTPNLNRIFGANLKDAATVRAFNEWFVEHGVVPPYQVLGDVDRFSPIVSGFVKLTEWDHVVMRLDDLDGSSEANGMGADIKVERIDKRKAKEFIAIYEEAFNYPAKIAAPLCRSIEELIGEPDVVSYIATLAGEAVATGQMFLGSHGLGYLGSTGTLPAARRAGCQAVLDRRRIADAREAGYRQLCRQVATNSQSWRNAMKVGFQTVYREEVFTPIAAVSKLTKNATEDAAERNRCCSTQLATR